MEQPNIAQNEPPLYLCFECNEPVFFVDGIIYRPCGHDDAPVLANLQAVVYGQGTAE